jgi:hypothetical protein
VGGPKGKKDQPTSLPQLKTNCQISHFCRSNKRKRPEESQPTTESEKPAPDQSQSTTPAPEGEIPPYTSKVLFNKREIVIRVLLHKVPLKFIQVDPTEDEFILNTFGWSKKYYLRFPYQDKIKVNPEACEAKLENNGALVCTFPIVSIKNKETGKIMRKKQKTSHTSAEESGDEVPEEKTKKVTPKKKKDEVTEKPPKPTSSELSTDATMKIIDQLTEAEETKRNAKLERSASREQFLKEKKEHKEQTKKHQQEIRKKSSK